MALPYEVQYPDGMIVRVPTYEEAARLRREAVSELKNGRSAPKPRQQNNESHVNGSQPVTPIWAKITALLLNPKYLVEHKVLAAAKGAGSIATDDLSRAIGAKHPGSLGARIAGIGRICTIVGVDRDQLLIREGSVKKGFSFKAGALLLQNELPPVPRR